MTPADRIAAAWRSAEVASVALGDPPLDPEAVFATVVAAAEPFRHGMRFRVLPSVVVDTGRGRARNIVPMLPAPGVSLADHVAATADLDAGWCLTTTEPLFVHRPTWSDLRDALDALWTIVGLPLAPVRTEVLTAHGGRVASRLAEPDETSIFYGLSGVLSLRTGDAVVDVRPGDAVVVPPGRGPAIDAADAALVVRVGVRTRGSSPVTEVVDALAEAADEDGAVPYLPWDDVDGEISDPLAHDPVPLRGQLADATAMERADLVRRLARRSAGGLEPPLDPRDPEVLDPDDVVALACEIHTAPEPGTDRRLWAVNGQVFAVGGPIPGTVLDRLRRGPGTIADLCRDEDGGDNGALPLLYRLDALHAIDRLEGESR